MQTLLNFSLQNADSFPFVAPTSDVEPDVVPPCGYGLHIPLTIHYRGIECSCGKVYAAQPCK